MVYAVGAKTKFNIVNTIYSAPQYGHRVYFSCLCFFGFALIWFRLLWILPSTIRIKTIWNSVNVERYVPAANSITLMHKYRESKKRNRANRKTWRERYGNTNPHLPRVSKIGSNDFIMGLHHRHHFMYYLFSRKLHV